MNQQAAVEVSCISFKVSEVLSYIPCERKKDGSWKKGKQSSGKCNKLRKIQKKNDSYRMQEN